MKAISIIEAERLPEAIDRVNQLHKWANEAIPKLIEVCKDARILKSGEIDAKTRKAAKPILDSAPFRAVLSPSVSCIWLNADITYPIGDHSVVYHGIDHYVGGATDADTAFERYQIYNKKAVAAMVEQYAKAKYEAAEATRRLEATIDYLKPFGTVW